MGSTPLLRHHVVLAMACGADLVVSTVDLTPAEVGELEGLLSWLVRQGHVASFSVQPLAPPLGRDGLLGLLRERVGGFVIDADLAAGPPGQEPGPVFLMPVWPFDHEVGGLPASTGQFLGLDLELVAWPSPDQEVGCHLPGREGLWLVRAGPLCSGDFVREVPRWPATSP